MTVDKFSETYGFKSKYYRNVAEKGTLQQQGQYGIIYAEVVTGNLQDWEIDDRAERLEMIYLASCQV